jgi:ArsR family transcriptional regulator, lead/cadmium/zinc/bismuth-responsive transcriptional repressor
VLAPKLDAVCAPEDHGHKKVLRPQVSQSALDQAERLFKALGDVPRLRLLAVLAQGEACVTELADVDQDGLSTVSQRLRVLHQANLVARRREGKHILYRLADQHIADLIFNALAHASEGPAHAGEGPAQATTITKGKNK